MHTRYGMMKSMITNQTNNKIKILKYYIMRCNYGKCKC